MVSPARHRVLIVGGGTAGITVAARLRRAGLDGVAVLEPSDIHYYQPLWTLVGGGEADIASTAWPEIGLIPPGVRWIRDAAAGFDPDAATVTTAAGRTLRYDTLVVAAGLQLGWDRITGLPEAVDPDDAGGGRVSSNYRVDLAPRTWQLIRTLRSGTAVFTMPTGPIKCAGAPQKIAYLAADHWRKQGLLGDIRIVLVLPDPAMFKVPEFSAVLDRVAARYRIEVRLRSELVGVDGLRQEATILDQATGAKQTLRYDLLHAVPPQSAPDVIAHSPLADPDSPFGYVEVDRHTLRSARYPNVFALGDVANLPTSKTGAAIRKQAPVLVANLRAGLADGTPTARYDGYSSCPFLTARHKVLLAEFDYDLRPTPSIPLLDLRRERTDMWLLKRYALPAFYWHRMLRGRG